MAAAETPTEVDRRVRVGIVDDHESVRLGLKAACENSGFEVLFASATAQGLVDGLAGRQCDVIVLDLSLGDGSIVTDNVHLVQSTGSAVLVHSIADRVAYVREALAAGAAGVIPKSSPTTTVMAAVASVARGDVLNNLEWATAIDADRDFAKAQLGRRERDVLHLYASGLPLKMVAMQLGIAHSTAREYLDRIRVKYVEVGRPAPTKVDLLRRAVEDGILPGLDADVGDGRV
ncbi:response regulator transcription factor [Cryobacterium frigoriphilum]|uniref:Response regulator transcription factor n=1 Tax=Cryobacterium frigoriphilum TaxID=1259150 RepID=A0A4R9A963_9MICO|nr:response regulator transcription factor [Cryobacterium frigoriphilum]TFD54181.1 response regulator transcription factor [Cryobacterium frigoriphilum]